jgi:hypothetical protein
LTAAALLGGAVWAATAVVPSPAVRPAPAAGLAAGGASGAVALTLAAVRRRGVGGAAPAAPGDGVRLALGAAMVVGSLPWVLADVGVYAGDVPVLRRLFLSKATPGAPGLVAVHLGHHHGMDGALLALTALALSRQLGALRPGARRRTASLWLAGLLVYGTARWVEDAWNEQVVKRGWARRKPPIVVRHGRPEGRRVWVGLAAAAAAVHLGWFGRVDSDGAATRGERLAGLGGVAPRLVRSAGSGRAAGAG